MAHRSIAFILLFLPILVYLTSCCDSIMIEDLNFSAKDLSVNPYSEFDRVLFKDQKDDTFSIKVKSRKIFTNEMFDNMVNDGNSRKCKGNYFNADFDETQTISTGSWFFEIKLTFDFSLKKPVYDKSIKITIHHPKENSVTSLTYTMAHFSGDTIFASSLYFDSVYIYRDTLAIGAKVFTRVYDFYLHPTIKNDEWATNLYYTIKDGVVGFETNKGNRWFLVN